jgi:hypothetical protein
MADLTLAPQPASIRLLTPGFRSSEWNFAKEVILDSDFCPRALPFAGSRLSIILQKQDRVDSLLLQDKPLGRMTSFMRCFSTCSIEQRSFLAPLDPKGDVCRQRTIENILITCRKTLDAIFVI